MFWPRDPNRDCAAGVYRNYAVGITGSFHSVSKEHLHRYCSEFSYRWNERKTTDAERTKKALKLSEGKRLMYKEPIRQRA
jgi:ISXO2-like transposase domain